MAARALAASILIAIGLGALAGYHDHQQRRGERAAAEAILALRITTQKMHVARQTIHEHTAN